VKWDRMTELGGLELEEAEALVGMPLRAWDGNCHAVSAALAARVGGVVRRGIFTGETTWGAMFHERPCQHSWIELPDGRVCDPTRPAFTCCARWPLWIGPADEYDIASCRSAPPAGPPPDPYDCTTFAGDEEREMSELYLGSVDYVAGLLGQPPEFVHDGDDSPGVSVTIRQAFYLANLPIRDEEGPGVLSKFFAAEVFEALIEAGFQSAIPVDRRDWILEDGGELYGRAK
jgi:hypothetical protein